MPEDGVHEIQLNGKQLVFLFMAATVAAVVIFLCGVLVGRGVPVQRADAAVDARESVAIDPTVITQAAPTATRGTSSTAGEILTYPDHLENATPPDETLRPPTETAPEPFEAPRAAPVRTASAAGDRSPRAVPATAGGGDPELREPRGNGFVVQVAAVRQRAEAEIIARRLGAKGYPAFVTAAGANVFRVRVGKFGDRGEAEEVAGRLEREERFKPWITR